MLNRTGGDSDSGLWILHSQFFISPGFLFPETFAKPLDEIHVFVEDGQDDGFVFVPNEEERRVARLPVSSRFFRGRLRAGRHSGPLGPAPTDPACIAGFVLCRIRARSEAVGLVH